MKIEKVVAREILDSRGNPTVEADVYVQSAGQTFQGRAAVPSGASTGKREALELRDGDRSRYLGKGVQKAVVNVNETIATVLKNQKADDILALDKKMIDADGTSEKSKLGANAILAVSMASCRAAASAKGSPLFAFLRDVYYHHYLPEEMAKGFTLPTPMMNILNGGAHADNNLSIQEFMILPVCGRSFREALRAGVEVFHELKQTLKEKQKSTNVGDEGGFAPNLNSNEETLEIISEAAGRAGYRMGHDIFIALDAAASEFYRDGAYYMSGAPEEKYSAEELASYYGDLASKFPIASIEDGLAEDDWEGWKILTQARAKNMMLVGDDLFVTNARILQEGIDKGVGNSILIKLNQIGSVSETLETIALARKNKYNTVISHRSGETEDTFLADLCVATDAGLIKTGSASRSDRTAKYNQLLRIEEYLGEKAEFRGLQALGWKF